MSVARRDVEMARGEDRKKAVAKAGRVVGPALLAPSRHVVKLLSGSGLGALFLPCKTVSIALAVSVSFWLFPIHDLTRPLLGQSLTRHEVNRHQKDVRVAIIHFDLVRYSSGWRRCPSDP